MLPSNFHWLKVDFKQKKQKTKKKKHKRYNLGLPNTNQM